MTLVRVLILCLVVLVEAQYTRTQHFQQDAQQVAARQPNANSDSIFTIHTIERNADFTPMIGPPITSSNGRPYSESDQSSINPEPEPTSSHGRDSFRDELREEEPTSKSTHSSGVRRSSALSRVASSGGSGSVSNRGLLYRNRAVSTARGEQSSVSNDESSGDDERSEGVGPRRRESSTSEYSSVGASREESFGRASAYRRAGGVRGNDAGESGRVGGAWGDLSRSRVEERQRLDGITVLLQRVGDRLLAIEAAQTQRAERIDSINYRITRLEVTGEEQKSSINELSANVRHRLQTSDFELEKIRDGLDDLRASLVSIATQNTKIQAFLEAQRAVDSTTSTPTDGGADGVQAARLKSVVAAVHGVRNINLQMARQLDLLSQNATLWSNISNSIDRLSESAVSKQLLRSSLADLRNRRAQVPLVVPSFFSPRNQQQLREPVDCYEVQERAKKSSTQAATSGVYRIQPRDSLTPFFAYCDLETEGGGWTVLQRRSDGSVDFLREWLDYKYGFGNLAGEFWLGNDNIHRLTTQHVTELRIQLEDFNQEVALARYSAFAIGSEEEGYALKLLGHYSGDAGDSLSYHVGQRWSTIDSDSDAWAEQNCARNHRGAWWYRSCDTSNLNGQYLHGPVPQDHEYSGMYWYDFRGPLYSLWRTSIMIRRGGQVRTPVGGVTTTTTTTTTTIAPPSAPPIEEMTEKPEEMEYDEGDIEMERYRQQQQHWLKHQQWLEQQQGQ